MRVSKTSQATISELEVEIINLFVHYAQMLNLPKSIGEIYGLLFCSEVPLSLDVIVDRLSISKGSASQGLRFLKSINAVSVVYIAGDRRDHYSPETHLRRLADGFLRERIRPHLETGRIRLERIESHLKEREADENLVQRLQQLKKWSSKAHRLLPVMLAFIGGKS